MTNEKVMQLYNELVEEYGDKLPNPDHYPKTFQYYVKLYKHYRKNNPKNETPNS
jgi:hypothetical protein